MLTSTERLLDAGYGARLFTDRDLARIYGGSAARRFGLANRAMAKGELMRVRRGMYCLGEKYRTAPISKYRVANCLDPLSIVSLQSGLAFHGLIPEGVPGVTSGCVGPRARTFDTPFGVMTYTPIPVRPHTWMRAVARQERNGQHFFVADPLRALADLIYASRPTWTDIPQLLTGLRIDPDDLEALTGDDFEVVQGIYRTKRVYQFLTKLARELGL